MNDGLSDPDPVLLLDPANFVKAACDNPAIKFQGPVPGRGELSRSEISPPLAFEAGDDSTIHTFTLRIPASEIGVKNLKELKAFLDRVAARQQYGDSKWSRALDLAEASGLSFHTATYRGSFKNACLEISSTFTWGEIETAQVMIAQGLNTFWSELDNLPDPPPDAMFAHELADIRDAFPPEISRGMVAGVDAVREVLGEKDSGSFEFRIPTVRREDADRMHEDFSNALGDMSHLISQFRLTPLPEKEQGPDRTSDVPDGATPLKHLLPDVMQGLGLAWMPREPIPGVRPSHYWHIAVDYGNGTERNELTSALGKAMGALKSKFLRPPISDDTQ
ncbi:hypothetical protein OAO01_03955 [Oligoflexia bacterium]|nr:hypothetical protein [Oligoflexia bacterium]